MRLIINHCPLRKKKLVNLVNIHTDACLIEDDDDDDSSCSVIVAKVTCKTKLSMEKHEQSYNQL